MCVLNFFNVILFLLCTKLLKDFSFRRHFIVARLLFDSVYCIGTDLVMQVCIIITALDVVLLSDVIVIPLYTLIIVLTFGAAAAAWQYNKIHPHGPAIRARKGMKMICRNEFFSLPPF
jgi:hypothetical protein